MQHLVVVINKYLKFIDNKNQINMYYEIGKYIDENNLNYKEIELYLRKYYGLVIAFTERNLKNMVRFSKYNENLLKKLEQITWKNILVIMKNSNDLIDICIKYKPTKKELIDYIKNKKPLTINEFLEIDDTLEELIKLKGVIL